MATSPEQMAASMVANMPEKTGKSLEEWLALVGASDLEKHGQIVKFLKSEHGVTHGYANLVAHHALGGDQSTDLVGAQYAGVKTDLRGIYDAVIALVTNFGPDVEVSPKKSYVSLRRSKQFGLVQASTRTRVDLGLNLVETKAQGRLELSGSFNAMVSHRVRIATLEGVDDELEGWLREAYDAS